MDFLFELLNGNKFDTADKLWPFLGFGFLAVILLVVFWRKMKQKISWFEVFAILGFLVLIWLSFFYSQARNFGFSEVYVITASFIIFLVFTQMRRSYHALFAVIAAIAFLSSVFGLLYFIVEFEPRIAGIFFDPLKRAAFFPNAFALFLLMSWPIAWYISFQRKNWRFDLLVGAILAALILTYSRGAWITFTVQIVIGLVFLLWKRMMTKTMIKKILLAAFFAALIVLVSMDIRSQEFPTKTLTERAFVPPLEQRTSVQERFEFFEGAKELALEKPWLGWGPFSFGKVYRPKQKVLLSISDHPHNLFLKIAAENGIPALILFIVFLLAVLLPGVKKMLPGRDEKHFQSFAVLLGIIGGIIHNAVDYNFNFLFNIVLFFVLLGIFRQEFATVSHTKIPKGKILAVLLSLGILYFGISETKLVYGLKQGTPEGREQYESTLFPRYYFIGEARKFLDQKKIDEAWHMLAHQTALSPYDAEPWNLKGDVAQRKKKRGDALTYFKKALELDPKNMLLYYRNVFETSMNLGKRDPEFEKNLRGLVEEYIPLLEQNAHFTAFTDNAFQASEIIRLLGDAKRAAKIRTLIEEVKKREIREKKLEWKPPFQ